MGNPRRAVRRPISDAHLRLGQALQRCREQQQLNSRQIPKDLAATDYFSSGHISNVENGYTAPSQELVESYIRLGGDAVLLRSLNRQMKAATEGQGRDRRRSNELDPADVDPPQNVSQVSDHSDVQKHYFVESQEAYCLFDGRGVIEEFRCVVAVRATSPGVRLYYTGHLYESDRRPGILQVGAISGGVLVDVRESPTGALRSYFDLGKTLSPDDEEPHTLAFRILVTSDVPARPILVFHNARHCAHEMTLRAQFRAPKLPTRIWRFAAEDTIDVEHPPPGATLTLSDNGYYEYPFDDLIPTWSYGFAWTW